MISLLDPLTDPRWARLAERHPRATVFHTRGWLEALRRTYGYLPLAVTLTPPGEELENAVVFCRVESWLTGRRLVSLPFTDHVEPLVDSPDEFRELLDGVVARNAEYRIRNAEYRGQETGDRMPEPGDRRQGPENESRSRGTSEPRNPLRYIELRPLTASWDETAAKEGFGASQEVLYHELDLTPGPEALRAGFQRDSVRRKIRRAARERIACREGRDPDLLRDFYGLQLLTRRRQGVPPQPFGWFMNLASCLGDAMTVRVAYAGQRPAAAIVTLAYRDRVVYKYGASDTRFNSLGGTQLLFWRTIEEACFDGARVFDLGRCDLDNPGLATFKERWGARRQTMRYLRSPAPETPVRSSRSMPVLRWLPLPVLRRIGGMAYRHVG